MGTSYRIIAEIRPLFEGSTEIALLIRVLQRSFIFFAGNLEVLPFAFFDQQHHC